ncbi:MAG: hypothetical protein JNL01_06000 [Bdellovibrionales bacterium]|nr:hypothetical protein [Bdellovibrionales bacterium]
MAGIKKFLIFGLGAISSFPAFAATRTVQFAGLASVEANFTVIQELNTQAVCTVIIVNTGQTAQIVDGIEFINSPSALGSSFTAAVGCGNGAAGQTIAAGQTCAATYRPSTYIQDLRQGVCAGRITVRDANDNSPGSVTATGSIGVMLESQVMGGTLAGALYSSGQIVQASGAATTGSMNLYCTDACQRQLANSRTCASLCGVTSTQTPYGMFVPRNIDGILEEEDAVNPNGSAPISFPTTGQQNGGYPKMIHTKTPTLFAGGAIFELNIGSMHAVCNGTPGYLGSDLAPSAGEPHFGHGQYGGGEQVDLPLLTGDGQGKKGEVLYCSHRHGVPDLISRVGSTTPVVINGGMPF